MEKIQRNVLLAPFTTFKIGGLAKFFVVAESEKDLKEICLWAKKDNIPTFILGGGSNILFSDNGFDGLVIKINFKEKEPQFQGNKVYANAGLPLSSLLSDAVKHGLSGLEWAIGIPGTIGGAVCGNTGAFGKDISDCVYNVKVFNCDDFSITNLNNEDCDFYYRGSVFKNSRNLIVLGAEFILQPKERDIIQQKIRENIKQRTSSFNHNSNCAGCFFKNVEWKRKDINKERLLKNFPELKKFADKPKISTGFLIDNLGLKNKKVGDAIVSNDHASFVLNLGNAKAEHVIMLVGLIKQRVYNKYGFGLEEEVQLIGFD
ncbi:MAG: UDP-N-acetylmuramate dehydrogenase [Candidatus Marinimicrobia bacterium]|nr:UDP-N-acetylmuramate dehydrogenase [Candidatus Neomarinimicrobiota bacterium]